MRVEIVETRRKIIEIDDCDDIEKAVLEKYNSFSDKDFNPLNTTMVYKVLPKSPNELGVKYDIKDIAEYIILYADNNLNAVNMMRLSVILYMLYEFYLYNMNTELFINDFVSYSVYPKSLSIFSKYCGYGCMDIFPFDKNKDIYIEDDDKRIINDFIKKYYSINIYEIQDSLKDTLYQRMVDNNEINVSIKFKAS